jgi:tRNA modification GTPase
MYNVDDTIVSLASGPLGAIGIIRLSGAKSFQISKKILKPNYAFEKPVSNRAYLLNIVDENGKLLDRAMVITYISPKSYTGEDMVEIFCHNSPYVVKKTLKLFIDAGARQAREGEFSFRAFINGKMDLSQAEAVNELIASETEREHSIAINHIEGKLSAKINDIKQSIIDLIAEIEVRLDDTYEEMDDINSDEFFLKTERVKDRIKKLADSFSKANFIKNGIKIAIVGTPNSGKSSLLNSIIGYERAITSDIPGTTRDTVEEKAYINGFKTLLIDTAGIREHCTDDIEKEGIKRTVKAIREADVVIYLSDISVIDNEDEKIAIKIIEDNINPDAKLIKVFSKSDLKRKKEMDENYIEISSKTGSNIQMLMDEITEGYEKGIDTAYDEIITSERHYNALSLALNNMDMSLKKIKNKEYELVVEDLRSALADMEEILGKTTSDDVLESIFKNFCVGK